jgi:hypothetical protein
MADPTGLPAIIAETEAGTILADDLDDAEQLAFDDLGLPGTPKRARGRPSGQRNKRNQRVADYLLARYRDPLEGLTQMASLGVEDIQAALGCTKLEAWQEKRLCAIAALPYLHQRQPIAVDLTNRNVVHLTINTGATEAASVGDGETFVLGQIVEGEIMSDQSLSDGGNDAV